MITVPRYAIITLKKYVNFIFIKIKGEKNYENEKNHEFVISIDVNGKRT